MGMNNAMTFEQIMHFASSKSGLLEPVDVTSRAKCCVLVTDGHLRRVETLVTVPAMSGLAAGHAEALGLNAAAHEAMVVKYYTA